MGFPPSVSTVKIKVGPLLDAGGQPQRGVPVYLSLSRTVRILESGMVLPTLAQVQTDRNGEVVIDAVATDSPGLDVNGFTYTLTIGGVTEPKIISLPAAVPEVNAETLVEVPASDGQVVWVSPDVTADLAAIEQIMGEVVTVRDEVVAASEVARVSASGANAARDESVTAAGEAVAARNEAVQVSSQIAVVQHGDDASYPRPVDSIVVWWVGTVKPINAVDDDLWVGGL